MENKTPSHIYAKLAEDIKAVLKKADEECAHLVTVAEQEVKSLATPK